MINVNNIIEFVSMRRGGHHAIMSWIIKNTTGVQPIYNFDVIVLGDSNSVIINDAAESPQHRLNLLFELKSKTDNIFINYEDVKSNYTILTNDFQYHGAFYGNNKIKFNNNQRILVIRDFYNNLCSRIIGKKTIFDFDISDNFIKGWKEHAWAIITKKEIYVKYDDWLINKNYRNQFLFENFKIYEKYEPNEIKGFRSSYTDDNNYLNRFNPDIIPEEVKNLIRKDNELHYLIGTLGYEYKEI